MVQINNRRLQQLFNDVQATIAFDQPKLTAELKSDHIIVEGAFVVVASIDEHTNQGAIATYLVKIAFYASYPNSEPVVLETEGNIPRNPDYHINRDGSCCVVIWEDWIATAKYTSVQAYFDGPLKNYFLGQHIKQTTGDWPFGERRHGKKGLIDAFAEILRCEKNERKIIYLLRILSKDWPRGHWDCPCKSGQIIRKCCINDLAKLSANVPSKVAKRMLVRLQSEC